MNPTEAFQRAFAAHLRNPQANPPPAAVDAERAGVYVELLYNNVEDFLSSCFPVIRNILDDDQWHRLVRQFYAGHACQSPYFRDIPAEFVQWFTKRFASTPLGEPFPFLLELAHYEWLEIPLTLADDEIDRKLIDPDGDLLDGQLVMNPVMHLQAYQYPVHRISPDFLPQEPEATYLILLRDEQGKIQFVVLNAVTARLVELLQETPNARAALSQLAGEMQHPAPEQLLEYGLQLLQQFKNQQVLLGASKP